MLQSERGPDRALELRLDRVAQAVGRGYSILHVLLVRRP